MKLAKKYNRSITGYDNDEVAYALATAAIYCQNRVAEYFIIMKNVKLSKHYRNSSDSEIIEMIEYFAEGGYDIVE